LSFGPDCSGTAYDYTWSESLKLTQMYNVPPPSAAKISGVYISLGKVEDIPETPVLNPVREILNWPFTYTTLSQSWALFEDAFGDNLEGGHCFIAREVE
jgi:hypothetical protein